METRSWNGIVGERRDGNWWSVSPLGYRERNGRKSSCTYDLTVNACEYGFTARALCRKRLLFWRLDGSVLLRRGDVFLMRYT